MPKSHDTTPKQRTPRCVHVVKDHLNELVHCQSHVTDPFNIGDRAIV